MATVLYTHTHTGLMGERKEEEWMRYQVTLKERGSLVRTDGQERLVVLDGEIDKYARHFCEPLPGHQQCCGVDDSHTHSRWGRGDCREQWNGMRIVWSDRLETALFGLLMVFPIKHTYYKRTHTYIHTYIPTCGAPPTTPNSSRGGGGGMHAHCTHTNLWATPQLCTHTHTYHLAL